MLQSILLLMSLVLVCIVAAMMGVLGVQSFRPFSAIFGFVAGFGAVFLIMGQIGITTSSLPLTVCATASGLLFAILGFLYRPVGVALGGIIMGYIYGVGLVSTVDMFLNYAIPPVVYTILSVALILASVIFSAVRAKTSMRASTAFTGAFAIVTSIILMIAWYLSNRGGIPADDSSIFAFTGVLVSLYASLSAPLKAVLMVCSALLGFGFFLLQRKLIKPKRVRPSDLFALDNTSDLEAAIHAARTASMQPPEKAPERASEPEIPLFKEHDTEPQEMDAPKEDAVLTPIEEEAPSFEEALSTPRTSRLAGRRSFHAPQPEARPVEPVVSAPTESIPQVDAPLHASSDSRSESGTETGIPCRENSAKAPASESPEPFAPRFAPRRSLSDVARAYQGDASSKLPSRRDRRK